MSTLRVDSIQGRTGSQVTIPSGTTLNVDGSLDVAGGVNYTGGITVGGVTQPVGYAASVIGGEVNTYTENGYQYESRTFWGDGTFTINSPIKVDFMIIGGGGAGGQYSTTNANGGGGAGGVVIGRGIDLTAGNYYIRVGQGGRSRGYYHGGDGDLGQPSYIEGPPSTPLPYEAIGGGGGACETGHSHSYTHKQIFQGGSGGGASHSYQVPNNPSVINGDFDSIQNSYSPSPMPITAFNNTPYMNSGIVKGYGNPGGTTAVSWTGAGGGGAGGSGGPGTPSGGSAWGGVGVAVPWRTGSVEYLAGGGGGSGNSTENAGNGRYGGGRGSGNTPTQPAYYMAPYGTVEPVPNGSGSAHVDAIIGSGGGGGAGSYHNGPSYGHPNFSGNGAPGRVMIRWRLT